MNESILVEAGLTEAQANTYIKLVENSPIAPPHLAILAGETRSNMYKILDQLEEIGLAQKDETDKKIKYWAKSPSALLQHLEYKREQADLRSKKLKNSLPDLTRVYLQHSEQPGVRHFQGVNGIRQMYKEQIEACRDITMVRSLKDIEFFGSFEKMAEIREAFNSSGIKRHMLTPDSKEARKNWYIHDQKSANTRTWLRHDDYTASVEWAVYADKIAVMSFGNEAMGLVIESAQIAEAFKQLLDLVDQGSRAKPDYTSLPLLAER